MMKLLIKKYSKMDALLGAYGDGSSDSESDSWHQQTSECLDDYGSRDITPLPPPPVFLVNPSNFYGVVDGRESGETIKVRTFPHIEGNYALHVFIPVYIPPSSRKRVSRFLRRFCSAAPDLHIMDVDAPLDSICKSDDTFNRIVLEREFHVSLGRSVPIRVHQIDSIVTMLRQRLNLSRRFWMDFGRWEVFTNDERTRSFVSAEVVEGGLSELRRLIRAVDEVYRLHNLPPFYKEPRPHISIAWAPGDKGGHLKKVVDEEMKIIGLSQAPIFSYLFGGIDCKIGKKIYKICAFSQTS